MSTVQKQLIRRSINRCARQRRVDSLLTLLSFIVINSLLLWLYAAQPLILLPFVFMTCVVHLSVVLYCNRLWHVRIRKWQAIERWCALSEGVRHALTLKGELQFSQPELGGTAEESHLSQPILS